MRTGTVNKTMAQSTKQALANTSQIRVRARARVRALVHMRASVRARQGKI